jgi:hypothetical protein
MNEQWPGWIGVAMAAFVALIALLQWRMARAQWRTAHNRAVFDQFHERYDIYQEFRDIVGIVMASGSSDLNVRVKAAEAAERAQFLFGDDIVTYLRQVTSDLRDLESIAQQRLRGADLSRNLAEQQRLKNRIEQFRTRAPNLFSAYMRFDQKKL